MTTANCRIVPYNDGDDASLTTDSAVSGFEVVNVQNSIRGRSWRSTSSAGQSFVGVWPANRVVNHFSLHRHLCHAGSVQFRLYSDAGASSLVYDSTALSATCYTSSDPYTWSTGTNDPYLTDSAYWLWFANQTARSFRVTFSGTPSQAYWQVGRLWIGRYFEVSINPDQGYSLGLQDVTDRNRSRGASLRTNVGEIYRTMSLDFSTAAWNDGATWQQFERRAGTGREILVSVFPGDGTSLERDNIMVGKLSNLSPMQRFVTWVTKKVQIEES